MTGALFAFNSQFKHGLRKHDRGLLRHIVPNAWNHAVRTRPDETGALPPCPRRTSHAVIGTVKGD